MSSVAVCGKTVLITGANSGIGFATSALATQGATIAARHWAISESLVDLSDGQARSHSGESVLQQGIPAGGAVTPGAATRTSKEHSLVAAADINPR
jgi:NAD(P)-dependent dehydrogenase (short-subunit alcohol dehydrogenase family)